MTPSVLGSVTLGYELLWNQKASQCCGVRLFVDNPVGSAIEARHLLTALAELWPDSAPTLLVQVRDPSLLAGLVALTPPRGLWLELSETQLANPTLAGAPRQAQARGLSFGLERRSRPCAKCQHGAAVSQDPARIDTPPGAGRTARHAAPRHTEPGCCGQHL